MTRVQYSVGASSRRRLSKSKSSDSLWKEVGEVTLNLFFFFSPCRNLSAKNIKDTVLVQNQSLKGVYLAYLGNTELCVYNIHLRKSMLEVFCQCAQFYLLSKCIV